MSDDDLLNTIRTQFADVRLARPVDDVVARGSRLRRRRRTWPVLGAGTGAAVAALAFSLGAPAAGPGSSTRVALDAWSVVSKPGGTVSLTIRDQRESDSDRARLAKVLRAAGVAAVVRSGLPPDCVPVVAVKLGITISRHSGIVTVTFKPGKLPKDVRVVVVIPAVVVSQGSRRAEIRIPPAALRNAPTELCTSTAPAGGR